MQSNHDEHNVKSLEHLDAIFDPIVKESGLYYAQKILKNGASPLSYITAFQEELLVLSETPIPNADIELIATETRNSTEEEANRLRKYLIVKFSVTRYDHIPD